MKAYAWVVLAACTSSGTKMMTPPAPTYTPTPQGTPVGTPTTQMIDSAGGTVTSADGRLDVVIPAGALSAPTAVTIQPITNNAPNGLGVGYRLSPEGTTFSTPATLTFHLDPIDAMAVDTTFVVTQYADGTWWSQPMQTRTADTVSLPAPHFSDWALAQTLMVTPSTTRVRVGSDAKFKATVVFTPDDLLLANPSAPTEEPDGVSAPGILAVDWHVTGAMPTGTITMDPADGQGDYTAPATPPSPSTVTITATTQIKSTKVIALATADIYAQEVWTGSSDVTGADGSKISATFTFAEDLASSSGTMLRFNVMTGTVSTSGPPPPSGCTLTVSPSVQTIMPNEGMMTATYSLANGPENPNVAGMGDTVWAATYTTNCPNGPGSIQAGVQAEWWPLPAGGMPVTEEAINGVVDFQISGGSSSGHVHLVRQ